MIIHMFNSPICVSFVMTGKKADNWVTCVFLFYVQAKIYRVNEIREQIWR